jgi:phage-related protein
METLYLEYMFKVLFMEDARAFLSSLNLKSRNKIIYNIDKASHQNDKELFKKLNEEIWEFRTLYNKTHYRMFAFWDKSEDSDTLVITTHGIIKKTDKTPDKEIAKAENLRKQYLKSKKP